MTMRFAAVTAAAPCAPVPDYTKKLWDLEDPADIEPGVAHTARWTAAMRAIEHERPDALFKDPLASIFAGPASINQWKTEMRGSMVNQPNSRSHIAIRCRGVDDLIMEEILDMAPDAPIQVVSIGAGMCTRPWRLSLPKATWYEVDRPDLIRLKTKLVRQHQVIPSVGGYVAIGEDLSDQTVSLAKTLEAHGFRARLPTLFVMEGMLYYLSDEDLEEMASEIQDLMGGGQCRIVMTCINESFLSQLLATPLGASRQYTGAGEEVPLFQSCWEPGCKQIFENAGWHVVSKISREDYGLQKLQVSQLFFGFPDPKTATEYLIVMRKKPKGIQILLDMLPWYCGRST